MIFAVVESCLPAYVNTTSRLKEHLLSTTGSQSIFSEIFRELLISNVSNNDSRVWCLMDANVAISVAANPSTLALRLPSAGECLSLWGRTNVKRLCTAGAQTRPVGLWANRAAVPGPTIGRTRSSGPVMRMGRAASHEGQWRRWLGTWPGVWRCCDWRFIYTSTCIQPLWAGCL